jgi:hypothetical protein
MVVGGKRHAPVALPPGRRFGIHCTEGCLGPSFGLDGCEKLPPPGCHSLFVQPVVNEGRVWRTGGMTLTRKNGTNLKQTYHFANLGPGVA